jgi:hypothetical protein
MELQDEEMQGRQRGAVAQDGIIKALFNELPPFLREAVGRFRKVSRNLVM